MPSWSRGSVTDFWPGVNERRYPGGRVGQRDIQATGSWGKVVVVLRGSVHVNGNEEDRPPTEGPIEAGNVGIGQANPSSVPEADAGSTPSSQPVVTPCPTSVRVGAVTQRNHSDLSASEKEQWGTWLAAMSQYGRRSRSESHRTLHEGTSDYRFR